MNNKERNGGLEKNTNNHVSLKPIALIEKTFSLFLLPKECNQKIYVPFSGSGSEIIGIGKAMLNTGYTINEIERKI